MVNFAQSGLFNELQSARANLRLIAEFQSPLAFGGVWHHEIEPGIQGVVGVDARVRLTFSYLAIHRPKRHRVAGAHESDPAHGVEARSGPWTTWPPSNGKLVWLHARRLRHAIEAIPRIGYCPSRLCESQMGKFRWTKSTTMRSPMHPHRWRHFTLVAARRRQALSRSLANDPRTK